MISYICLLATVFANLSCADDMDNSKFDNMIPYGKQEVSYTYPKGEGSLRVLTFNIRHCAGNDDVINYDRTAAVINGMEPDVVCLQEVDYMTTRSNKVDQLKTLADKTGMNYYFSKSIAYQGGEYGNGLLFKGTPISTKTYLLPGAELRSAAIAEFENYVVISTHLALEENNRVESAKQLTDLAKTYNKVVYMAGDFNEDLMNGTFFTELKKEWEKLEKNLGGIKDMPGIPDAIFVVDPKKEKICVQEAHALGITLIGIGDTNCDPEELDYIIPGNDDAIRAVKLITSKMADAVIEANQGEEVYTEEAAAQGEASDIEEVAAAEEA